jgi:hypothetical protein
MQKRHIVIEGASRASELHPAHDQPALQAEMVDIDLDIHPTHNQMVKSRVNR